MNDVLSTVFAAAALSCFVAGCYVSRRAPNFAGDLLRDAAFLFYSVAYMLT